MAARYSNNQDSAPVSSDFESLVNQYYAALFRFAMSLTHSEHDACDLVQDTFVTWSAKGHQLKDRSRAKSWLFTTLHRAFLLKQRRTARFPEVEIDEAITDLPNVEPDIIASLDGRTVLDLLSKVDPQFRPAVALFYLEDYSYAEIGEVLEVPVGTVKSRISRGVAQLRKMVAPPAKGSL